MILEINLESEKKSQMSISVLERKYFFVMKKILLAHKDEVTRRIFNIVFSSFPWEFIYVDSSSDALSSISADKPDMLIVDLPEGASDIYTHLRALNNDSSIPVLQICPKGQTPVEIADDELLASISKPFNILALTAYIQLLLDSDSPSDEKSSPLSLMAGTEPQTETTPEPKQEEVTNDESPSLEDGSATPLSLELQSEAESSSDSAE